MQLRVIVRSTMLDKFDNHMTLEREFEFNDMSEEPETVATVINILNDADPHTLSIRAEHEGKETGKEETTK